METIQIIAVGGSTDQRLKDLLLKLSYGTFNKTDESIELITTDKIEIHINFNDIFEENEALVKYLCHTDDVNLPKMVVTHYKSLSKQYIIGGIDSNNFNVTFYHRQAIPDWQLLDYKKNGMRMKRLKGFELSFLAEGIKRGLLPVPKTGQCLSSKRDLTNFEEFACFVYFDHTYYGQLVESINNHYLNGSFANSNAEKGWMNFKLAIESATTVKVFDLDVLNIYSLTEEYKDS